MSDPTLTLHIITKHNCSRLRGQIPPQSHLCGSNFQSTHRTFFEENPDPNLTMDRGMPDGHASSRWYSFAPSTAFRLLVVVVCIVDSGSAIPHLSSAQLLDVWSNVHWEIDLLLQVSPTPNFETHCRKCRCTKTLKSWATFFFTFLWPESFEVSSTRLSPMKGRFTWGPKSEAKSQLFSLDKSLEYGQLSLKLDRDYFMKKYFWDWLFCSTQLSTQSLKPHVRKVYAM